MGFKHFYKAILIRLLFVVVLSTALSYLYFQEHQIIWSIFAFILLILSIINVIIYFNKINIWISSFLLGIKNEDTSLCIPNKTGNKSIDQVFEGMNNLNELFKQIKIDISTQEQYFKTIINQSSTGLFSVNSNGRVIHINPTASQFIGLQEQHHINALVKIDKNLPDLIKNIAKQNETGIFENKYGQKLLFNITKLNTVKQNIILVAVSDISKELDSSEVDAWVKLARTLSHEIMNNITPITTLSQVVLSYYTNKKAVLNIDEINKKTIDNTVKALYIIEERSRALMNFVENYRKFTKLPEPILKPENISELLENTILAISTNPQYKFIRINKNIATNVRFTTDANLLSQVIINLLKNACEAFDKNKADNSIIKINLQAFFSKIVLNISNNGAPILPEVKEQIFVPFFTTKEDGSGIGLSLSKQILLQMNADIFLKETNDEWTCFEVVLA